MTIRCVEPGEAIGGSFKYLVEVPANDELLFPHVDSCIAIAFVLNDGRMIGGHVGMMMPGADSLDAEGNAMQICKEMIEKKGEGQVTKVILVGDGNWEDVVPKILKKVDCTDTLFADTGAFGGGVDVTLNPRRSMVFIQLCTGTRALIFQRPYAKINGHQIERLLQK